MSHPYEPTILSRRDAAKLAALTITGGTFAWPRLITGQAAAEEPCVQTVPGTLLTYYLVAFDKHGAERPWDGESCSTRAIQALTTSPITDVFIFSHGWMGDVTQAKNQYRDWISAMASCQNDIEAMGKTRPGFLPLLIGIHWPSLPFGDEELRAAAGPAPVAEEVDRFAERIANTPRARQALQTILIAARQPPPESLPPEIVNAFQVLRAEAGLQTRGAAAAPGADAEKFDPQEIYQALRARRQAMQSSATPSEVEPDWVYNVLYVLAIVSFWTMKNRARHIGESGGRQLLLALQSAVPSDRTVRFHLMGHSFGCIVVSSIVKGAPGDSRRIQPVNSVSLVQGALSLWSYSTNAYQTGTPGYFRPILDQRLVSGPIITTQSSFDTAVRTLYPYAAGIARQVAMADRSAPNFPKYGGIGTFGIQGDKCDPENVDVLDVTKSYGFKPGRIYNIDCSRIIRKQSPVSGAHSDISHPEVAHAVWEAAMVQAPPLPEPAPAPPFVPPAPSPTPPSPGCRRLRLLKRRRHGRFRR